MNRTTHAKFDDYVARFPEAERFREWLSPQETRLGHIDQAFLPVDDLDRFNTLPGGYLRAGLFVLTGPTPQVRLLVTDNDDGDWFKDWPFSEKSLAVQIMDEMKAYAPFSPADLGPIFGLWSGGEPPLSRKGKKRHSSR